MRTFHQHSMRAANCQALMFVSGAFRLAALLARGSTAAPHRLVGLFRPSRLYALLLLASLPCLTTGGRAQIEVGGPTATVQGTYTLPSPSYAYLPNFYTWGDTIYFSGSGWGAHSTPTVHLVGPLNFPGVASQDYVLGKITADGSGNLTPGLMTQLKIPAIQTLATQPTTPRPSQYILYATLPPPNPFELPISSFPNTITLSPRTIPFHALSFTDTILWPMERGGRDGVIGEHSPERTDPEWVSVWDTTPVAFYATVADTMLDGGNQPAFISHEDLPWTHFGHDVNLLLVPDPQYAWILGDANYNTTDKNGNLDTTNPRYGRIEWEWETQNDGNPGVGHYGHGVIGLPLFAMPATGDRIFTVGRWVMDNGHPDTGDRTEIHPPRMIATIRKRNTAVPFGTFGAMTRASQVDIYVSGHGGGADMFPDGLDNALNVGRSILRSPSQPVDIQTYFAWGPHDPGDPLLNAFAYYSGMFSTAGIQKVAGPSGVGWFNGSEERFVNTMDYDFDVPLPAPPAGAVSINVQATTQPEHTTGVQEVITYFGADSAGRPTGAHIHLPYNGADNGIYARTLKFYWDVYNPPGEHYRIQLNSLSFNFYSWMSAKTLMWTDVCGQWSFLTATSPDQFLSPSTSKEITLPGLAPFDVYLDPADTLYVFTQGYDAEDFEALFGTNGDVGKPAYDAGIHLALTSATASGASGGENVDLGGMVFQKAASPVYLPGHYVLNANSAYFFEDFNVTWVPGPPLLSVSGVPVNLGQVNFGSTGGATVSINNVGESPLYITGVSISGAGYSFTTDSPVPGSGSNVVHIFFRPTNINQGAGTLTIQTNDPVHPSVTYPLSATVVYPIIHAIANTSRTPSLVVGTTTTWPVTITNTGTGQLRVKPTITGAGFSIVLPSTDIEGIIVPPGGINTDLTVKFTTPFVQTKFVGILTLTSNDPINPTTTLTFGAEGVPVGMRVLVVQADGTPYDVVDHIHLKYTGKPKLNTHLTHVPLHTINPPESWKTIQYDYMTALAPTNGDDVYELTVKVKNKKQTVTFTLAPDEFKQILITLP